MVFVLTHFKNTGVRIYNKRYDKNDNETYLKIIVKDISKNLGFTTFKIRTYNNHSRTIVLPIIKNEYSDYVLTKKNNKRGLYFGIIKNQGLNRIDELKIAYNFPDKFIQKGRIENGEFIEVPLDIKYFTKTYQYS